MKTLRQLHSLKQFREREAEQALTRQIDAVERCRQRCHQCEDALRAFRVYAKTHELELYADLCSRMVGLGDIEDVQHAVTRLREEEAKHVESLEQARADEAAARDALKDARRVHQLALRATQKFTELVEASHVELSRTDLLREELELDEAGSVAYAQGTGNGMALTEMK